MISTATVNPATATETPTGGRLVTDDGRELVLRRTRLLARARGGLAQVRLEQVFHNPHADPLRVTYKLPLPSDGAVSGFSFTVGEETIVGEVDRKQQARERFEQAILDGHTAAILDEERSSLFTQEIGNIPPGSELVAELVIDQRLRWLSEGEWEWRFPTVVGPRYLGGAGRVEDPAKVSVLVRDPRNNSTRFPGPRSRLELNVADVLSEGRSASSPSHELTLARGPDGMEVGFGEEAGVSLDRDVVVRWPVAMATVGTSVDLCRPPAEHVRAHQAFGLLTITPPAAEGRSNAKLGRDLILLIDTSGSMGGEPLEQAARVLCAVIDTLDEGDRIEMIEFSSRARRWKKRPVAASPANRQAAKRWLKGLRAGGGTEMRTGILEALRPLHAESQRQVVLVTDGYIGFEREIVSEIGARVPTGCRVHTIGVGHAVNRSLTEAAARAGRGLEVILAPGEDPEPAALRLVARTSEPRLVDLELTGSALIAHAPRALPDLFSGSPVVVPLSLDPTGGEVVLRARGPEGGWERRVVVRPADPGCGDLALARHFARESVEDLEVERAMGKGDAGLDEQVEALGLAFQISTRMTSWVAISSDPKVDPGDPTRRHEVPQDLPAGLSILGLGLRAPRVVPVQAQMIMSQAMMAPPAAAPAQLHFAGARGRARPGAPKSKRAIHRAFRASDAADSGPTDAPEMPEEQQAGGVFERIADGVRDAVESFLGGEEDSEVQLDEDGGSEGVPGAAAGESPSLAATLVRQDEELLTIEFEVGAESIEWRPDRLEVLVELEDGRRLPLAIDSKRTTKSLTVQLGQIVRLALRLEGAAAADPVRVDLRTKGEDAGFRLVLHLGG
jgi:Ca-activated chloride channel family protein